MAISNAPTSPDINENWLFQFTADNQTCLEFHPESGAGNNDGSYIDCGNALANISPIVNFTIEFWIKADDVTSVDFPIVSKTANTEDEDDNDSFVIKQSNDDIFIQYEYGSGSNVTRTTSSVALAINTWTHISVVRSAVTDDIKVYKNGALAETESDSTTDEDPTGADSSDQRLYIGANFAKTKFYDGELAHVRVWNIARDALSISKTYNSVVDSNDTGLVAYWKLNEGYGTIAYDSSTNSNNGTLSTGHSDGSTNLPTWAEHGFDQHIHAFGLALRDTVADSQFYHGSVLNNNISVRESIDITNGTSSNSNLTLTTANFDFEGTEFYKTMFNYAERDYHNKEVRVYSQVANEDTLSNCQRIFTGRLVEVKLNQYGNVTIQINAHSPWDGITFPQTKHAKYNVYEPVVYGAYTYSDASSGATNDAAYGGVFPVPILYTDRNMITTLMPKIYTSNSHCYLHHYVGFDHFCSVKNEGSGIVDTTSTQNGINILETPITHRATGWIRTNQSSFNHDGSVTYLTNPQNATDYNLETGAADTNTYATADINAFDEIRYLTVQTPNKIFAVTIITGVIIKHSILWDDGAGDNQEYQIDCFGNQYDSSDDDLLSSPTTRHLANNISTHTETFNAAPANAIDSETALLCPDELLIKWVAKHNAPTYDHEDHELRVYDIQMRYENRFNYNDNDAKRLSDLKYFYCGAAGLTATWDDGAIVHGHDAHRDLLQRFAGIPGDDPTGWSALNTDRAIDNWKVRYWQLEPTSLKEALEKLAYEFGFVQKFDPSGNVKYIYVKQASELSATTTYHNLTNLDINNVNIQTTGIGKVVTQMDINNKKHPAESNQYYSTTTATNLTSRVKYNLGSKEGIKEINLDANVGTIPTTADADCNADFYSYYNNIVGDMKVVVQCDVVNCMKGYQFETGDIVTFDDMPVEMFGTDFSTSKYFMIVELKRSPGKVSITAREVG